MAQIKALLFDLGKVLVDFDHNIAAKRISQFCRKSPRDIFELFFASEITCDFEAGRIQPFDFFQKIKQSLNLGLSFESFIPIWNEIFYLTAENRAVYSLAVQLGARYSLAMVSNINTLHYEYLKKNFPVFGAFSRVFTSFELGLVKPDPEIYRKIISELKLGPESVFYTDDRAELVEGARAIGINSCVFQGVKKLKNDLECLGVDIGGL